MGKTQTFGKGNVEKERRKILAKEAEKRRLEDENPEILTSEEKLQVEIGNLKNVIRNCKNDLDGLFKGNRAIENKMKVAQEQLDIKLNLLNKND